MKELENIERTDLFGNALTLQDWLSELGMWKRLERKIGIFAIAALWKTPVPSCVAWEFTWASWSRSGWKGWCVYDAESQNYLSSVWAGIPMELGYGIYSDKKVD